jgi:hypothetical protein
MWKAIMDDGLFVFDAILHHHGGEIFENDFARVITTAKLWYFSKDAWIKLFGGEFAVFWDAKCMP